MSPHPAPSRRPRSPGALRRLVAVLTIGSSIAAAGPSADATTASQRGVLWSGRTEHGGQVFLRTVRHDGVRRVVLFQADLTMSCPDTGQSIAMTFAVSPDAAVSDGAFAHDEVVFNTAFHLTGSLASDEGVGTVSLALATFTPEEEPQRCDSGPVAWRVHRRTSRDAGLARQGTELRIDVGPDRVTVAVAGASEATSVRGSPGTTGDGEPIRPWFGETQQRIGLFFETIGRPGSRRIGFYDIVALAPCPGSDLAVGLQIFGYAALPLVAGAWRIDEVGLFAATHWGGAIADGVARGTLEMNLPAFAPDEEIVVCTSDVAGWRARPGPVVGHTGAGSEPGTLTVTRG